VLCRRKCRACSRPVPAAGRHRPGPCRRPRRPGPPGGAPRGAAAGSDGCLGSAGGAGVSAAETGPAGGTPPWSRRRRRFGGRNTLSLSIPGASAAEPGRAGRPPALVPLPRAAPPARRRPPTGKSSAGLSGLARRSAGRRSRSLRRGGGSDSIGRCASVEAWRPPCARWPASSQRRGRSCARREVRRGGRGCPVEAGLGAGAVGAARSLPRPGPLGHRRRRAGGARRWAREWLLPPAEVTR
jgi:hypothetical protein